MEGVLEMVDKGNGGIDDQRRHRAGEEGDGISPAPQKLARTDLFPFRMPPNGPTFYNSSNSECRPSDLYDGHAGLVEAAPRSLQPFPVSFRSPGMASLRFPFTATQWQELEQQALIFKHMMAAVPVPPDLLAPIRGSLSNASPFANVPSNTTNHLGWGGFSLRFSSTTDPEPGRCRRTDGKKWRCSRDVAPDQKYCERHMHRGRPRSRKPVELQLQRNSSDGNNNGGAPPASNTTSASTASRSLPLAPMPFSSSASSCPSTSSPAPFNPPPSDAFAKASWFKLPTQTMMASSLADKTSSYMNWMRGEANGMVSTGRESTAASHQWELMQSKLGQMQEHQHLKLTSNGTNTSLLNYRDHIDLFPEPDIRNNTIQSDHRTSIFLGNGLSGLESANEQMQPRRLIDAWSRDGTWLSTTTTGTTTTSTKSSGANLTLSPLSLSMSASGGNAADEIDPIAIGYGTSGSDIGGGLKHPQPQTPSWMFPVSWQSSSSPVGGPLAEVLQSSSSVAAAPSSPKGCISKSSSGGLNLMCDGWGEGSPRNSPRLVSSPTGVLQKTLASLSDSSSGSSPTFGAKPEMALQWLNQQPTKLPSS